MLFFNIEQAFEWSVDKNLIAWTRIGGGYRIDLKNARYNHEVIFGLPEGWSKDRVVVKDKQSGANQSMTFDDGLLKFNAEAKHTYEIVESSEANGRAASRLMSNENCIGEMVIMRWMNG